LLNSWERLLVDERITLQALNLIKDLPGKTVALVSDKREIVVRESASGHCFTGQSNAIPTAITELGWASSLFACLVSIKHDTAKALAADDLSQLLGWADDMAGLPEPGSQWPTLALGPKANRPDIKDTLWNIEISEWGEALRDHGIVRKPSGQVCLEVWRGSTYLPGYIACIRRKREIINRIGLRLISFRKEAFPSRSLSIMLQADPGAGKTLLAKCLAKGYGFYFLHYDITQMLHRDDLIELFDVVATKQAKDNEKILVFVDEINAMLDAGHAFGSFLSPLEENIYVRRGNSFSLKPCVWVFAGTQLDDEKLAPGEKFSDFKSRMTMVEHLDYSSLAVSGDDNSQDSFSLEQEARLEQVYLGATMIRGQFSDVQEVAQEVLDQFYRIDPKRAPARRIRQLASLLRNVQYGRVTRENCADWDVTWEGSDGIKDLVTLVF
jgi:ATPase family associated with various cellular activities (AAA)